MNLINVTALAKLSCFFFLMESSDLSEELNGQAKANDGLKVNVT